MKMTLSLVAALAMGSVSAHAATVIANLPTSAALTQTSPMAYAGTPAALLETLKGKTAGVYAGGNNNSLSNWAVNGEGTWVNTNNSGTITLCGRTGVAGDSFGLVLSDPSVGDVLSGISFTCNTPSGVIGSYTMVLGVYTSTGTLVSELTTNQVFQRTSTTTSTISLDMSDSNLTWQEGYKIVAGIKGGGGTATSAYTISGIQVSYDTVVTTPEPATASLSLLGLAALMMRRRRA